MKKNSKTPAGYSAETLARVTAALTAATHDYMTRIARGETVRICVSTGNSKIGRTLNVSLPPLLSCANCSGCRHYCYDINACVRYGADVINARARNFALVRMNRGEFFRQIDERLTRARRKIKLFRWHVAGDILDLDYLARMIDMARRHADWTMWTYTKRYDVVAQWISDNGPLPANLSVMLSEWKGMPLFNPYGLPEFRCVMPGETAPDTWHCPGDCGICYNAHRGCPFGESAWINLHR